MSRRKVNSRIISLRRRFRVGTQNMNEPSKADRGRVGAMRDEAIDTSDIPPLPKEFFDRAKLRVPRKPATVTVHVDPDVLAWYHSASTSCRPDLAALRVVSRLCPFCTFVISSLSAVAIFSP